VAFISGAFIRVVIVTLSVDKRPASLNVAVEFWISFQVVESKRAIALSVEEAGQTTSPDQPQPQPICMTCLFEPLLIVFSFSI
jgi:hypothetical protein